ncbi:MAG: CysZ protein [Gammaproteobacteria bacterium]|jgi:CysZ protein
MIRDFLSGAAILARAIQVIKRPEVRLYAIMPLLINVILFGGLIWYGYAQLSSTVDWLMSFIPDFLDFIRWIIWFLITGLTTIVVFFTFTPIANVVAAPFNALLSERIEAVLTGNPLESNSSFTEVAISSIRSQVGKLIYILLWSLGLLLISFIPVINFICPFLWIIFGAWLLSLEYFDYPMGNHDLSFANQKKKLGTRRGLVLGFGGSVMVLTTIPLINFVVMPLAVAGATIIWVEQLATSPNGSNPKSSSKSLV